METTVSQRVIEVMKHLRFDPEKDKARFSREIGLKRPDNLYNLLNGHTDKSSNVLGLISKRFENISLEWMLHGVGAMEKTGVNELEASYVGQDPTLSRDYLLEENIRLLRELKDREKKDSIDLDKILELERKIDDLTNLLKQKLG